MAKRHRDPREKVINALEEYWALKEANSFRLTAAILNSPLAVQEGMFLTSLDIIYEVGDRGKEERYAPGSAMESRSIQARKLTGDL